MQLFLKPFYSLGDADTPVDTTKDWQCTVLSFAAHALFLSIAVFCMPVSTLHQKDLPRHALVSPKFSLSYRKSTAKLEPQIERMR